MAGESSLPKTDDFSVIRAAIAFEIAKMAMSKNAGIGISPEDFAKKFANIYMESWKTITERNEDKK